MYLPLILQKVLLKVMGNIENAYYNHMAMVCFDDDFCLVDENEFKDLIEFLDELQPWEEYPKDFKKIVP